MKKQSGILYLLVVILTMIFSLCILDQSHAQGKSEEWVSFETIRSESAGTPPEIQVLESTLQKIVVDITIPGANLWKTKENGVNYQYLNIPGSGYTTEVGRPQLPMISRFIAIPVGAQVNAEVVDSTSKILRGYAIHPAQEALPDIAEASVPPFVQDEAFYQQDVLYPVSPVEIEGPGQIRGTAVGLLQIYPVQYNPAKQEIHVYSHLRIILNFVGGQERFIEERYHSAPFDSILERLALNGKTVVSEELSEAAYSSGNRLLIITHSNFLTAANKLATWKREKGIYTTVVTTATTGSTVTAIKNYIQNAYNSWNPPPTYVLFIGDAEFIPCHYVTTHPYTGQGRVGTDLYYATVRGSDYFPDINIGRLSVDTLTEAANRVNGIIAYEKMPPAASSFYRTMMSAAYFQDDNDWNNVADRRFAQTAEDISLYMLNRGYTIDREYYTDSSVSPQYWGNQSWNFGGGLAGNPGGAVPSHLRKPGFTWNGSSTGISSGINSGRFLVTHRDHGARTGWGDPSYATTNVTALRNGNLKPVVWSMNCQTGWFDNETDDSSTETPYSSVYFSEAWERNPNGGAIGVIGATRVSYSGHNDRLAWGWMDAIWPGFISSYSGTSPAFEMGTVLNYGKLYYATMYSESTLRKITFEMFHWFGDPTMQIWTALPASLSVSHPSTLSVGATSIQITIGGGVTGATISVTKNGQILGRVSSTTRSTTTVSWGTRLSAGDQIKVTVTKHNYRPYQKAITIPSGFSYLLWTKAGSSGSGTCSSPIPLKSGVAYNGTTVGGVSNFTTYNCTSWNESGPEKVHRITTTTTGTITAALTNLTVDLDVFILNACSQNYCKAYGNTTATYYNAPAGTYYIVADGYFGAKGTYTLKVTHP